VAARAPSGTNTQPWKVYVLTGEAKTGCPTHPRRHYLDPAARQHTEEYAYYPREWVSPFIDRRRKVGWDLYALLGLTRDNKAGMAAQHAAISASSMPRSA
jgi:nitroreductase